VQGMGGNVQLCRVRVNRTYRARPPPPEQKWKFHVFVEIPPPERWKSGGIQTHDRDHDRIL
jgi:hypothetical protein